MYTHASQFPHLAGLSREQILAVARRGFAKRPLYHCLHRARNILVFGGVVATIALMLSAGSGLGLAMLLSGAISTIFLLVWNVVWVNTVLFRVTLEEVEAD